MQPFEKIDAYVRVVLEQIRWKKARPQIQEEIKNHVIDQRDAFMAQGLDESAATEKAVAETGDAADIGLRLDRIHRPRPQWAMLALTVALLLIGIFIRMVIFGDARLNQLAFAAISVAVLVGTYFLDFTLIGKYPKTVYFSIVVVSIAVMLLSPIVRGRPLYAPYTVMLFPLAFAAILFACRDKGYKDLILCALAFVLPAVIMLRMPFMSGFIHYAIACIALFSVAICKNWFEVKRSHALLFMLVPIAVATLAFVLVINKHPHMRERFAVAFNPWLNPMGGGYYGITVRVHLENAKWFGMGSIPQISNSMPINVSSDSFYADFLLTAITSHLGWAASVLITGVLLFFIVKGFLLCFKQTGLGLFVSAAIMTTFAMQVVGYVVYNLGILLLSPLSLPFISYGNTAMLINAGLVGFMLSVFRTGHLAKECPSTGIPG